jgi:gamma-glutamylaminecyclotransferase
MQHIFVYGSLKRGYRLHGLLANQQFLAKAVTVPGYRLFDCGSYPGLTSAKHGWAVEGELYVVDDSTLVALDEAEGVDEGLYERRRIQLQPPHDHQPAEAWFYLPESGHLPDIGHCWPARDRNSGGRP